MDLILVPIRIGSVLTQNRIFQVEPDVSQEDITNVTKYLESGGWLTEHKVTAELEEKIKACVGRKHSMAVPNGTIAIYLSLLAAGITKGKKVAVPNITMIATINAVLWADAIPVLVDVDEDLCMSYKKLTENRDLDAVIFVPLNGRTGKGENISSWCKENEIILIEDSAHALGSNYKETKCGSLGDISILSFTPHKIITMGQGGMVLTNNDEFNESLVKLKTFNRSKDKADWHDGFGLNFKITDIQASLGLSQFKRLDNFVQNKKDNFIEYKKLIKDENIEFLDFKEYETPWFFDVLCVSKEYKDKLKTHLNENNIETRDSYPALSFQKYLEEYRDPELGYSESICERVLWLPSSNNLTQEQIERVSEVISSV